MANEGSSPKRAVWVLVPEHSTETLAYRKAGVCIPTGWQGSAWSPTTLLQHTGEEARSFPLGKPVGYRRRRWDGRGGRGCGHSVKC